MMLFVKTRANGEYCAHSKEGCVPQGWQPLDERLKNVAEMARSFADSFGAGGWGYLAGLWYDLGKCSVSSTKRTESNV
jgi:hypothetical protein